MLNESYKKSDSWNSFLDVAVDEECEVKVITTRNVVDYY